MSGHRTKEPKCCCCKVRVGLSILFILSILFGIYGLVTGNYVQGAINLTSGVVGMASVFKKSVKLATFSVAIYILLQLASIAISIYNIANVDAAVNAQVDILQKDGSFSSGTDIGSVKSGLKEFVYIFAGIAMALNIIFAILITERMIAYRKWLKTERNTFENY